MLHFFLPRQFFNDIQEVLMNDLMNIDRSFPSVSQFKLINVLFYGKDAFGNKFRRLLFNRDLNRGCLVYMFSLRFSVNKFLIKLRRQFRVRYFFSYTSFWGICSLFILYLKLLLRKAEAYLEPKRASTMELFCEYT